MPRLVLLSCPGVRRPLRQHLRPVPSRGTPCLFTSHKSSFLPPGRCRFAPSTPSTGSLSENVVNRMKDFSQPSEGQQPSPPPTSPSPSAFGPRDSNLKAPQKESKLPRSEISGGQQPSGVKEDLERNKQEHATVQDKCFHVAKREREVAMKHSEASVPQGEGSIGHEEQKSPPLARELETREAELRRRDSFYKEQLGHIEKKNAEMYKLSSQQFHEAASKMESTIKPRSVEPVCSGLQAQILRCYRDHLHEVLLCSDLVKAYQHCVSAAHKG
ncbi:MICOS complex subunit MIC25 isoform X2 [Carlito syrichta]|uniref:MICOS complex subunit MIC25 isoform X2 n=1 Tax=Carlito syrichta TaxID=1868482 RepID=A0A3Q0EGK2_CARSF|nr:MICOS complex subunit MIC25 isoform X2 [Carlito syrichta]